MLFRQLFDTATSTYTYLLADPITRHAVVIDPVREQVDRDAGLIRELGLTLVWVLETHVHADHITGGGVLAKMLGAKTALARTAGADADRLLEHGDSIQYGRQMLEVRCTPGHTAGCLTFVTGDLRRAFTGDALLIRGCGRTDFQGGSASALYRSVHDQILSLPDDTRLYPAHDYKGRTVTTVREERLHNPRLGNNRSEDEFVEIMDNLGLPYPQRMDVAVPANLRRGLDENEVVGAMPMQTSWETLRANGQRTATGVYSIDPEWLAFRLGRVVLIDVREADEVNGPLGRIPGSYHTPLAVLPSEAASWERSRPTVLVCRSGGRSSRGAQQLAELGFTCIASLDGGMERWQQLGLPREFATGGQG